MKEDMAYEIRSLIDLRDMLGQSEKLYGDCNAFLIKHEENDYRGVTYKNFKADVEALGTALMKFGLQGSNIALLGENSYQWCTSYLAVVNGTGVVVPLDKELSHEDLAGLLKRCNARAILFSGKSETKVQEIAKIVDSIEYFINFDAQADQEALVGGAEQATEVEQADQAALVGGAQQDRPAKNKFLAYSSVLANGYNSIKNGDRVFLDAHIDPDKQNMLLFTSGTTDTAKGVLLSHRNICANITGVCQTVRINEKDSSLSLLPIHHTYQCTIGFLALIYNGAAIAFCEGLKHIAKNLKEVQPTVMVTVPLLLESIYKKIWEQARKKKAGVFLLKLLLLISAILNKVFRIDIRRKVFKKIHNSLGGRMRLILTGAAAIDPEVSKGFRLFGIQVLQGYGLTECSPLVTGNRDNAFKDGSIGLPIPGMTVKVFEPNEHGIGEIVVKGPCVMQGYYNNQEATDDCIKDGWFHTGDLGKLDNEGFFYITGRTKNVIVTKNGKNIYPEELESYINRSPFVLEAMVWGMPNERTGETLVNAQIFPNIDAIKEKLKVPAVTKEDLVKVINDVIKSVNKSIPQYKHVRSVTLRDNEFIKTTTKKIKRYLNNK